MRWTTENEQLLTELVGQGMSDTEVATELSRTTGLSFTKDSVRGRRKKLGLDSNGEPKTFEELVSEEKKRAKSAQERTALSREVKEQARFETLMETIREAIGPLNFRFKKLQVAKSVGQEEEIAVLNLGDLHFGKKTTRYNVEIAKQRFANVITGVKKITALHRKAYPIRRLVILWGGDIVDGEGIYPTQPHHTDQHLMNQIFSVAPDIADHLGELAQFFDEVECHCVRGNHGRISKFAHEDDNFDNIFYHTLRLATRQITNLSWNIPTGWHTIVNVYKERILLTHGHQIKMTLNLPWYGITTRIGRWVNTEQIGQFTIAHLHHFHTSSRLNWGAVKVFTNGTLVSGDEFALEMLGLESNECQWFYGIHPERGVTWAYELQLEGGHA